MAATLPVPVTSQLTPQQKVDLARLQQDPLESPSDLTEEEREALEVMSTTPSSASTTSASALALTPSSTSSSSDSPSPSSMSLSASHYYSSSKRRSSVQGYFASAVLPSCPPSASYTPSLVSSTASSPGGENGPCPVGPWNTSGGPVSPMLSPSMMQWTGDLRQYIMTDIGPQPANSQVPPLRFHATLIRQRSFSKISSTCLGGSTSSGSGSAPMTPGVESGPGVGIGVMNTGRHPSTTDLCTIPQHDILPPMDAPYEKRFAHDGWDDEE
ncbi:hypothetical protein BGW38_005495 [Lunasporangiospora selenospora]|uniref:Uncharacterized protein n=1 Tax=Lunasporangiospora selenospora TaxID=979761 RepID=A0A9P6FPU6_9FUNG|nr:hypothetical protein BGW38_005495 [Lunasporangiospora selenospora]